MASGSDAFASPDGQVQVNSYVINAAAAGLKCGEKVAEFMGFSLFLSKFRRYRFLKPRIERRPQLG